MDPTGAAGRGGGGWTHRVPEAAGNLHGGSALHHQPQRIPRAKMGAERLVQGKTTILEDPAS